MIYPPTETPLITKETHHHNHGSHPRDTNLPGIKEKEPKTKQKNVQNIVGKANTRKIFQNH